MATSDLQGFNCPLCDTLLFDNRILNCAHTFCVTCLKKLLKENEIKNEIKCPLCRTVTHVEDGEISKLNRNIALSEIIDDVKGLLNCNAQKDHAHKRKSSFFCLDCNSTFCKECFDIHSKLKANSDHKTFTIEEYKRQVLSAETKDEVQNNTKGDNKQLVCSDCNTSLSDLTEPFHRMRKHKILPESKYISEAKEQVERLQVKVVETLAKCRIISSSYASLEEEVRSFSYNMITAINKAYNENLIHLQNWKLRIIRHCQTLQESATKIHDEKERKTRSDIRQLMDYSNLVGSNSKDINNIAAFVEVCNNLSALLTVINARSRSSSLEEQLRMTSSISFHPKLPDYGELQIHTWQTNAHALQGGKSMAAVDINKQGCIAIGYFEGGVELYEQGKDANVVLEDRRVSGVAFLRDGCFVLLDVDNKIELFSPKIEPKTNKYKTLTHREGGDGFLAVDGADNIYICYRSIRKIHIFARQGGAVTTDIDCSRITPQQLAALSNTNMLVMDGSVITKFSSLGQSVQQISYPGCYGYPCVSSDGSFLVAWVDTDKGSVRIDKYTNNLKVVRCVYCSSTICLSGKPWYMLRELPSGDLAFCTKEKLFIFEQIQQSVVIKDD